MGFNHFLMFGNFSHRGLDPHFNHWSVALGFNCWISFAPVFIKHLCVLIHIWTSVRLTPWNWFKPPSKNILYWPFQGGVSFVDHFCYIYFFMFVMLFCLFIAALWSPVRKRLTSWLSCVFLSLFCVVSWVRCGTWLYRCLIFASLLTLNQTCT